MSGDEELLKYLTTVNKDEIDKITAYINNWKTIDVNIGVIGMSGSGKSTFINTIRNLKANDPGAAAVGVTETTVKIQPYPHPKNENLIFWDLPGVGTKYFPRENYKKLVDFPMYDFYLLLSSSKFLEDDAWLNKEIQKSGKKHFFVRSKIDLDVANEMRDNIRSKHETLSAIRKDLERNLNDNGVAGPRIFLIACYDLAAYDFDALTTSLIANASTLQKEALSLTLYSWTNFELLREKRDILKKRIRNVALKAAAATLVPFYGETAAINMIVKEANLYQEEFQLDAKSLEKLAEKMKITYEDFTKRIPLHTQPKPFTAMGLAILISVIPVKNLPHVAAAAFTKAVVSAFGTYADYEICLRNVLKGAYDDACKIHSAYMKLTSKL